LNVYLSLSNHIARTSVQVTESVSLNNFINEWQTILYSDTGPSGLCRNKLRLYKIIKFEKKIEQYCKIVLPPAHRSAFCKLRFLVAPIRHEGLSIED
jgi:hypothetical protein